MVCQPLWVPPDLRSGGFAVLPRSLIEGDGLADAVHVHSLGVHSGVSQAHALRSVVQKAEGLYHPSKLHKGASDLGGQTEIGRAHV